MIRVVSDFIEVQIKSVFNVRNSFVRKYVDFSKCFKRNLVGIYPEAANRGAFKLCRLFVKIFAENGFHSFGIFDG